MNLEIKNGDISIKSVTFSYGEKKILDNFTLNIPGGKTTAIVGTSGGGKTTLLRLIYRFYDPDGGSVEIDGINVKDVKLESLRKNIAIVPQDMVLFNDTIEYNIRYGKLNATKEEIEEVAKKAQIHEGIMRMPQQYDTFVGERGLKLSGGEKQRICIARALLKNPSILLLDEVTSNLDAESEYLIQKALKDASTNRTVLIISHRMKTIQSADNIIVLDGGHVAEQGPHEELLRLNGTYSKLYQRQITSQ